MKGNTLSILTVNNLLTFFLLTIFGFASSPIKADEIRVATASNFSEPLKIIARRFEETSSTKVTVISGSTGKLYAQVINGAPFDAFFSADIRRAELLEQHNIAIPNSRFTYAIGKLILWSPEINYIDLHGNTLLNMQYRYLAIANPKLAPYGRAAYESLTKLGLWKNLQDKMVRGENIGQAFQYVKSGNAELGLVALSQVKSPAKPIEGSFWKVPESFYSPIKQQAVLLKEKTPARQFFAFVKNSKEAHEIIRSFGYSLDLALTPPTKTKNHYAQ